ncbi:MAG TPA: TIGR00730 family Rossman fold protein, partial [Rhizomicrobium sp.]
GGSELPAPHDRQDTQMAPHRSGRTICVFCGSSPGNDPAYAEAARELGRLIGENGYRLVFGGGNVGLMGEVARATRAADGPVIGILPSFLRGIEPPLKSAEELIVTPDLQQRKARMLALSDAFVILPGGLGTLDEYFEVVTTTQLRVHAKPIIVVDVANYYAPLKQLLDQVVAHGFALENIKSHHVFVSTPRDAMETIGRLLAAPA